MKSNKKFICDICAKEKNTQKMPVYDENFNKLKIHQCEDCFNVRIVLLKN